MLTLNDGRAELWQWDTGRTLAVDADCSQVHFSNKVFGRSIDVDVVDGAAIIPDILLQTDRDLSVWAFVGTAENGYTKISKTFKVNRRNKPSDYVFTQTDQITLQTIQSQIGDLADLTTEAKDTLVAAINEAAQSGGSGTLDHAKLTSRDAADQHPMSAIAGLEKALEGKQPAGAYLTEESDPTVPDWAKAAHKPSYTASEVGADPSGTASDLVAVHNTGTDTHSDIRLLVQGLTDRLNALADSDDTTLDQLSEVVAYIKSNRDLIEAVTTAKVNVADIIDNLTTNVANKPLSASQGVVLKALIDAITIPEKLPNPNALTFTGAASATYDGSAPLTVEIPSGGGGGSSAFMIDTTTAEEVSSMSWTLPAKWKKILILNIHITVPSQDTDMSLYAKFGDANNSYKGIGTLKAAAPNGVDIYLLKMNENYMGLGQSIVQTYPSNARPAMPSTSITPSSDSDQMMLYSNTSGINFPTGTIFKIWGVYAP